jgi:hypothetical protein
MTQNLCTRTERKLRRLGYAKKPAHLYAGFLYVSMMSVCGLMMAGMRRRRGQMDIVEKIPRSIRHALVVLSEQMHSVNGSGIIVSGPRAVDVVPASSRIHRR